MRMVQSRYEGVRVWCVQGTLEVDDAPGLRRALAVLPADGTVIFDLAGLEHVSSAGLGVLVGEVRRHWEAGGTAILCRPTDRVAGMLRLTMLRRFVPVAGSVDEALTWLRSGRAA